MRVCVCGCDPLKVRELDIRRLGTSHARRPTTKEERRRVRKSLPSTSSPARHSDGSHHHHLHDESHDEPPPRVACCSHAPLALLSPCRRHLMPLSRCCRRASCVAVDGTRDTLFMLISAAITLFHCFRSSCRCFLTAKCRQQGSPASRHSCSMRVPTRSQEAAEGKDEEGRRGSEGRNTRPASRVPREYVYNARCFNHTGSDAREELL